MNITVANLFKGTNAKAERAIAIEKELSIINATKDLLAEQYQDITKALMSNDFNCKSDIKFSEKDYVKTLAKFKYVEKSLVNELDSLKSNSKVNSKLKDYKKNQAVNILKSLYRDEKLSLDQFNKVAVEKAPEGQVKYADIIVINNQNEICLFKRSIWEDNHKGAWVIPGGHVDAGEEFETAAKRELSEETGLNVDKILETTYLFGITWQHVGTYKDDKVWIEYYCLNVVNPKNIEIILDEAESRDYLWVPYGEIRNYPMIFNMKSNVMKIMGWQSQPQVKIIRKAIQKGIIPIEKVNEISKALQEKREVELFDKDPEQYRKDKAKKNIEVISKAVDAGILGKDILQKSLGNMGHLVPKKVQIKGKNGRIFTAIRWVDPKTGEPVVAAKTKSVIDSKGGVEEKVIAILHANTTDADKIRHLVNEGIYDDSLIGLLVGMVPYHVRTHLTKAGIDPEEYKKKSAGKEDEIKKVIEEQQAHNDTPEDIENNMLLNTARDVERLWKGYDNNLESVVSGEDKFALCYGVGGVGKSYHCKQMLKKYEQRKFENEIQPDHDQYDYVIIKGKITPGQVYATMYRHRDKLIVFDDCDSFLITDAVQGYLKTGLDTDEDCEISNITSKPIYNIEGDKESGTIPNVFKFLGRVIAISNLTADDLDSAVLSRALPSNLSMTIDETLSQLEQVKDVVKLYTADKSEEIPISQEIRDKAFNLMKGFKNIVSDRANVRVLQRSMLIIKRGMEKGNNDLDIKREVLDNYRAIDNTFGKEQAALKLLAKEQKKNK